MLIERSVGIWKSLLQKDRGVGIWKSLLQKDRGVGIWKSLLQKERSVGIWKSLLQKDRGVGIWKSLPDKSPIHRDRREASTYRKTMVDFRIIWTRPMNNQPPKSRPR